MCAQNVMRFLTMIIGMIGLAAKKMKKMKKTANVVNGNKEKPKAGKDSHANGGWGEQERKGLDSESECEAINVGECFYFNSLKEGCPKRNSCGYQHRYAISAISGKARFYLRNAPIEKPKEVSGWKHDGKTKKRKWGNGFLGGPNTLVMEISRR